jgi:uncharacterized protein (TIGR03437 family)
VIQVWFWGMVLAAGLFAQSTAPFYSHDSIVNSVTNTDFLAPNVIATIYGTNLAWSEHALTAQDVAGGNLPLRPGGEAEVQVAGSAVGIYYVSPKQINFLIPGDLRPGTVDVRVVRQGVAGPAMKLTLLEAAPSLFPVAQHADGPLLTTDNPGRAGEWIVLYALGLGPSKARLRPTQIPLLSDLPLASFTIQRLSELRVIVNGTAADASRIWYAGLSPGFAGLYQINFQLPDDLDADAEIRIALGEQISPSGLTFPARGAQ